MKVHEPADKMSLAHPAKAGSDDGRGERNEVGGTGGVSVRTVETGGLSVSGFCHPDEKVRKKLKESLMVPGRSAQGLFTCVMRHEHRGP